MEMGDESEYLNQTTSVRLARDPRDACVPCAPARTSVPCPPNARRRAWEWLQELPEGRASPFS